MLRAKIHPVDFLMRHVPCLLAEGFEIYGEEKLKVGRVNRNTPTISFNISSGIDWFDVKAVVSFGDIEVSFKDIRRALRKKESYIKLADGTIGQIPGSGSSATNTCLPWGRNRTGHAFIESPRNAG